ncbi:histidine phosphatase family protein [Candidatus Daviesbacteria bacterium]|nr:histidine phosphatase family protein [Candidatus Daviesbacteria bacterium]
MKVYVIRHGLTELNKKKVVNGQIDEPLALEGIEQARAAISLIPKSIKHLYTSPLQRAQQTAQIINSKLMRPISVQIELTEIHMGSFAGKSWGDMKSGLEMKKKHRTIQFDYRSYGGESAAEVKKRIINFLKIINNQHNDYEVLIVTHGGIIRLFHLLEHNTHLLDEIDHIAPHTFDLDKILKQNFRHTS